MRRTEYKILGNLPRRLPAFGPGGRFNGSLPFPRRPAQRPQPAKGTPSIDPPTSSAQREFGVSVSPVLPRSRTVNGHCTCGVRRLVGFAPWHCRRAVGSFFGVLRLRNGGSLSFVRRSVRFSAFAGHSFTLFFIVLFWLLLYS